MGRNFRQVSLHKAPGIPLRTTVGAMPASGSAAGGLEAPRQASGRVAYPVAQHLIPTHLAVIKSVDQSGDLITGDRAHQDHDLRRDQAAGGRLRVDEVDVSHWCFAVSVCGMTDVVCTLRAICLEFPGWRGLLQNSYEVSYIGIRLPPDPAAQWVRCAFDHLRVWSKAHLTQ
jgi:hypothetical protein